MLPLLEGIRVVEVGAVVLGPYAGQILADLGAEVIKVEPLEGDIARNAHPSGTGGGALFVNNNRNKRMLALDLKAPEGRAALARLIGTADVLFHNMRVDAAERLGLGFEAVAAINPRIVHCAAIGFGQRGPYRDRPAFDDIIQAASGIAGLATATGGDPRFVPTILADKVAALHAVYGILAALVARANGREGAIQVEVPMFEALAAFLLNEHLAGATFATDGAVGYPRLLSPDRRPFRTADGWIAVLPYTDRQWRAFLAEIGREDVIAQDWFADPRQRQSRIGELYALVAAALPARATADWIAALEVRDVPCSKVSGIGDLLTDPHLTEIGFFDVPAGYPDGILRALPQPVRYDGVETTSDTAPRELGADSRLVLAECGFSPDEIDALFASGAVSG
ncbi:CoA transferase [Sphingomonas koreensis]|uniref:CaiB/BaiF CoA transferase family protein n=1 Tax=Sphingomonas koreensis TaxID=93064 RepID=UPI00083361E2|nr:CoA transferase [Sphingomonas koreensis]PJI90004.1 crotonobetainyl-CoA:carnitine CoA-transferase CaiB-like acyl-CoA transferase [Sphingomonas koreensis]RSU62540.1 CoA transferase [Sphingomonas koreensis]RSU70251.1 CoA transferase [Sphingomonas koreensis]